MAIAPEGKSGNMILRFFTNYRSCRERSGNGGFDLKGKKKEIKTGSNLSNVDTGARLNILPGVPTTVLEP